MGVTPAMAQADPGLAAFGAGRFAEAVQSWGAEAAAGDPAAALYLGVAYDTGEGVAQDYGQALQWYRRAAEGGSAVAMFNVAVMYDAGRGVPADAAAAAQWYGQAAARGLGRAEYNLGLLTEAGTGVPRDRVRAIALFRAAAGHGISAARLHLASLGASYAGVVHREPRDAAMEAFQKAQQLLLARDPAAMQQAAGLFRRAADEGNPLAQYDLGYCYAHGIGLPVDQGEAVRWFRVAASHAPNPALRALAEAGVNEATTQVSHAQR